MFLVVLKFVHIFFGVVGMGSGAWVLRGVLCGKLFKKWALLFLLCALITSASGLLFPLHDFLIVRWAAMSAVYVGFCVAQVRIGRHLVSAVRFEHSARFMLGCRGRNRARIREIVTDTTPTAIPHLGVDGHAAVCLPWPVHRKEVSRFAG
jgi:hypothetical protein